MREAGKMRDRYLRDDGPTRLGNLASNLLRLGNWVRMRHNDEAVVDLMREIAWLMEWCGEYASEELAEMQREICRWRRAWPVEAARSILAFRARVMSSQLLKLSGLLEEAG